MARYDYRCVDGHVHEETWPIATAPDKGVCGVVTEEDYFRETCFQDTKRMLSTGTSFMINKVMSPPAQRLKPGHINI